MWLFNRKKKENKNVQRIDKNSFLASVSQLSITELEYIDNYLKANNISFEFSNLAASIFSYYFSIWYVYLNKYQNSSVCDDLKRMYEEAMIKMLADLCNSSNFNKEQCLENFNKNMKVAINEASNSINGETFNDAGFTDKFLYSFLQFNDIMQLNKPDFTMRILKNWVHPVAQVAENIVFTD